jgi:hypothetical protein
MNLNWNTPLKEKGKQVMIYINKVDVYGFEPAIRGMRNPKNSWSKSDSTFTDVFEDGDFHTFYQRSENIGNNDLQLMQTLFKAGTEHRKYDRMIVVWMDITAPLYWWKEFDTYKVGTVADSCSTMHKIHSKEFTTEDFSTDRLLIQNKMILQGIIDALNEARQNYLETKNKMWWWQMIQLLPSSYMQKRTIMMNYEVCARIIQQRSGHKLDEWFILIRELKKLPYLKEIMDLKGD